ncbi:MAG: hypothetical protein V4564_11925 [Pseudomonadota bacterium]|uniref:hypothetical protein n=1 Tax=Sphingomonas sp. ERG5 TaxID=1381597 RepID=UPI00068EFF88|nr:hypothetical protein [Sphingomonas sp. ERG5]
MAKKDKSAKTAKAAKLPKRIAGIKVPKELRKSGAALLEKANSPIGREVIAAGITAVVAAAARSRAGSKVAAKAADPTTRAAQAGAQDAREIVDAIGTVMQRLFEKKAG